MPVNNTSTYNVATGAPAGWPLTGSPPPIGQSAVQAGQRSSTPFAPSCLFAIPFLIRSGD